ncbi:hypothetical protein [Kaistia nematophila]|uniref:Peptidase S24/S26A/S26B/S26C domain-containing protein n=1 Tax=Kaistia nematophila TaxID=2994654 RepID=A0A9X3IM86_9HYPH|nr:hypothetical protein [Kaistia nematophila]MCX5569630.1 hypothetical protein [Kaistia nematophila]
MLFHDDHICDNRNLSSRQICDLRDGKNCAIRNNPGMTSEHDRIREWLRRKLEERGHGAKGKLASHLKIQASAVSRMLAKPGKQDRGIEATTLREMERYFGERIPLNGSDDGGDESASDGLLPIVRFAAVAGEVAAGVWQEEEIWDVEKYDPIPVVPGRYANLEQRAYLVRGPSVDQMRIFDGDFAIAVKYWMVREAPVDGDLVIVTRRKGDLAERTIKEIQVFPDRVELWPRSSDPRFQAPIVILKDSDAPDDVSVEITDLVIGSFRRF